MTLLPVLLQHRFRCYQLLLGHLPLAVPVTLAADLINVLTACTEPFSEAGTIQLGSFGTEMRTPRGRHSS